MNENIKLRFERGEIPKSGNITIMVKNESKYSKNELSNKNEEIVCMSNTLLSEFIEKVCEKFDLIVKNHRLYQTDWLEDPINPLVKYDKTLNVNLVKHNDFLILRDNESVI